MNIKTPQSKMTIQDIARQAGVSKATVSQVINGSPKVSRKTNEKVLTLIQQFHYEPSKEARRLAQRRWAISRRDKGALPMEPSFRLA